MAEHKGIGSTCKLKKKVEVWSGGWHLPKINIPADPGAVGEYALNTVT